MPNENTLVTLSDIMEKFVTQGLNIAKKGCMQNRKMGGLASLIYKIL